MPDASMQVQDYELADLFTVMDFTCSAGETLPFPTMIRVGDTHIYRLGHTPRPAADAERRS